MKGLGLRIYLNSFRVQGLGFRVQGLGFKKWYLNPKGM